MGMRWLDVVFLSTNFAVFVHFVLKLYHFLLVAPNFNPGVSQIGVGVLKSPKNEPSNAMPMRID